MNRERQENARNKGDTNEASNVNTTKQGIANKDVNVGSPIKNWRTSNLVAGAGIIGRAVSASDREIGFLTVRRKRRDRRLARGRSFCHGRRGIGRT